MQPNNATPRYGTHTQEKRKHVHTKTCTLMFKEALFIIAKEKQIKCLPTDGWINKKQQNIIQL